MIRELGRQELPMVLGLWQEAFGDSETEIRGFFEAFPRCRSFAALEENRCVSMVHALPRTLKLESRALPAVYFYAAATAADRRGRGLFRQVLAFAEQVLAREGTAVCTLCPASESLFDFYGSLGYETAFYRRHTPPVPGEPLTPEQYLACRAQLLTGPHLTCDRETLDYAVRAYGLELRRTDRGICACQGDRALEVLPEDLGGDPCGMAKWLKNRENMGKAFMGFALE